jgi:hypothetical protein
MSDDAETEAAAARPVEGRLGCDWQPGRGRRPFGGISIWTANVEHNPVTGRSGWKALYNKIKNTETKC